MTIKLTHKLEEKATNHTKINNKTHNSTKENNLYPEINTNTLSTKQNNWCLSLCSAMMPIDQNKS